MNTIPDLILKLEAKAANNLNGLMSPFTDNCTSTSMCCPWLRWFVSNHQATNFQGLFLMQDWGLESEDSNLSEAIEQINKAAQQGKFSDTTMRRLFEAGYGKNFTSGNLLISNAVWGLRPDVRDKKHKKSGCLPVKYHKQSFPIWGALVAELASRCTHDEGFTLTVAGDWATFSNFGSKCPSMDLSAYLMKWVKWSTSWTDPISKDALSDELLESLSTCRGTARYIAHPSHFKA